METLDLRKLGAVKDTTPDLSEVLIPRELPITVRYREPGKPEQSATVFSRILQADDKARIARIEHDMAGGRLWDFLPPDRQSAIRAFATVCVQLGGNNPNDPVPEWLAKALHEDEALVDRLYAQCLGHAAIFFGADHREGEANAPAPRFVVDAPLLAARAGLGNAPDAPSA